MSLEAEEKNKALVRRLYKLDARGDIEAMEKLLAPDFVDHSLLPDQDPGREGYLQDGAKDHTIFSNIRYIIEDQLAEVQKTETELGLAHHRRTCERRDVGYDDETRSEQCDG